MDRVQRRHAQIAAYNKSHYVELKIRIPKGRKAALETYLSEHGETANGLINRFLADELGMTSEEWKAPSEPVPAV